MTADRKKYYELGGYYKALRDMLKRGQEEKNEALIAYASALLPHVITQHDELGLKIYEENRKYNNRRK